MKKPNSLSNALKSSQTLIQIEGWVKDHMKANDHIICEVDSHDIWVKFRLSMEASSRNLESELELKID